MKNKILAIFGIGAYILSILSSAENLEGTPVAPTALVIVSGVAIIAFIVLATVRLYNRAKNLSVVFAFSAIISFVLTTTQIFTQLSYGSPIIILANITKVIYLVAFILVIIKLFKIKEIETVKKNGVHPREI